MVDQPVRVRQLMDGRAAIVAGLIAGAGFLLTETVLLMAVVGSSPWVIFRYIAATGLGPGVLPPPATFDIVVVAVALGIHFFLSVVYALVLAFIIHRWGLIVGIVGGALFGLALYAINHYTFTLFFPWFFAIRSWIGIVAHVVYGVLAGGVYEALERETVIVDGEIAEVEKVIQEGV